MRVVRDDRSRPDDAVLVVVLLDDRRDRARRADAVAAHHQQLLLSVLVQECRMEGFAVVGTELEDVSDLDRRLNGERATAVRAAITLLQLPDVGEARLIIPARLHAA